VFCFGARFYGSTGNIRLHQPIVGMESLVAGNGYRLVASDGGIFDFGAAHYSGSLGGTAINSPVVAMAPGPQRTGYWLVQADGWVSGFGGAPTY
jgi:hypothetical protein